jgi:beta-lactamase class A
MPLNRRALFSAVPALIAWPALSREAPGALVAYERESGGRIGLYAENVTTGLRISWRANERFVMCSTFKASLAAMILGRVDHGHDQLKEMISYGPRDVPDWYAPVAKRNLAKGAMSVADMCAAAVEYSDNTCANLLLARVGGPAALTAFWRSIGDSVTRLDHIEPILNRSPPGDPHDTTTPAAMADNLRRLLLGRVLSPGSRERLTGWMVDCKTGGKSPAWRYSQDLGDRRQDGQQR